MNSDGLRVLRCLHSNRSPSNISIKAALLNRSHIPAIAKANRYGNIKVISGPVTRLLRHLEICLVSGGEKPSTEIYASLRRRYMVKKSPLLL